MEVSVPSSFKTNLTKRKKKVRLAKVRYFFPILGNMRTQHKIEGLKVFKLLKANRQRTATQKQQEECIGKKLLSCTVSRHSCHGTCLVSTGRLGSPLLRTYGGLGNKHCCSGSKAKDAGITLSQARAQHQTSFLTDVLSAPN